MATPNEDRLRVQERRRKAVELRLAGLNATQIAHQLPEYYGHSEDGPGLVRVDLQRARDENGRAMTEGVEELRDLQVERLERLLAGVWKGAVGGDTKSADAAGRLITQICKLRGLEPPTQVQLTARIEMEASIVTETLIAVIDTLGLAPDVRMRALGIAQERMTAIAANGADEVIIP